MADVKKLAEELVNLKVTEVNELAQILKEEYGIKTGDVLHDLDNLKLGLAGGFQDHVERRFLGTGIGLTGGVSSMPFLGLKTGSADQELCPVFGRKCSRGEGRLNTGGIGGIEGPQFWGA